MKDVGTDSSLRTIESPSRWPIDFEKKQQEIIELWHECNVSIVHRTYFFLLFKGDQADNIYMEVEHRRLSFIKNSFSANGELNATVSSRYFVIYVFQMYQMVQINNKISFIYATRKRMNCAHSYYLQFEESSI